MTAAEIDPNGRAALSLNAEANDINLTITGEDLIGDSLPPVDIVAVGDLFYAPDLATRVTAFLDRCLAAGIQILIGDPGRIYLPRSRLRLLAEYPVPDFGDAKDAVLKLSGVYAFA